MTSFWQNAMAIIEDLIPIFVVLGVAFFAIAIAIILNIRSKKSLLFTDKNRDFIDDVISKKKTKLAASLGGITWATYLGLLVLCPTAGAILGFFLVENKAYCVVFAFVGLFVPEVIVRIATKRSKQKFDEKYAMALRSLASGLRSGLTVEQAVDSVGQNAFLDENIRASFRQIAADVKVGIPMATAFKTFAAESGSKDAEDVAAVIAMQSQVGGSEAEVISTIVQNINSRIMTRNEIKAVFADTDMLILIMDFMPFVTFAILYFGARQMIQPFFDSAAMTFVLIGIMVFTVIGSFVVRKISKSAKGG